MEPLRIGGLDVDRADAFAKAQDYLSGTGSWGYPAYDAFQAGGDHDHLSDGDLLAPVLLNVGIKISTFYSLCLARPRLEAWLAGVPAGKQLTEASEADIDSLAGLFAVADEGLPGVRGTTLAKVMHRKRPAFVPLYDRYIWQSYVGVDDAPIGRDPRRTWREFMPLLAGAMIDDLNRERAWLLEVASAAGSPVPITTLRALDIVAWQAGKDTRNTMDQATDDEAEEVE